MLHTHKPHKKHPREGFQLIKPHASHEQASESRLYTFSPETKAALRKFRLGTSRAKDAQAVICTVFVFLVRGGEGCDRQVLHYSCNVGGGGGVGGNEGGGQTSG